MDEQVRSELTELLKTGGRNLCTLPQVLGNLLRQRCPDAESTVADIEQALRAGCVQSMLATVGAVDEVALAEELVSQSGMAPDHALWVIETWVQALAAADTPLPLGRDWSAWNRLDVKGVQAGGGSYQRAIGNLMVVGAAGAIGGAGMGLFLPLSGEAARVGDLDILRDTSPWLQVAAFVAMGALGGLAGAIVGWIAFGGRSRATDSLGGTTLARLTLSALAAFFGAGSGVLGGLSLLGLIGVMLGALVGAVVGLLAVEVLLRIWP